MLSYVVIKSKTDVGVLPQLRPLEAVTADNLGVRTKRVAALVLGSDIDEGRRGESRALLGSLRS